LGIGDISCVFGEVRSRAILSNREMIPKSGRRGAELHRPFEPSELLGAADAALYQAKNAGRDQLVVGPTLSRRGGS
jgi:GGDEF domain-containing protein